MLHLALPCSTLSLFILYWLQVAELTEQLQGKEADSEERESEILKMQLTLEDNERSHAAVTVELAAANESSRMQTEQIKSLQQDLASAAEQSQELKQVHKNEATLLADALSATEASLEQASHSLQSREADLKRAHAESNWLVD